MNFQQRVYIMTFIQNILYSNFRPIFHSFFLISCHLDNLNTCELVVVTGDSIVYSFTLEVFLAMRHQITFIKCYISSNNNIIYPYTSAASDITSGHVLRSGVFPRKWRSDWKKKKKKYIRKMFSSGNRVGIRDGSNNE